MAGARQSGRRQRNNDHGKHQATPPADIVYPAPPEDSRWITDYAWVCGLAGAATLWFGVRFSNLTHCGIIRRVALCCHPPPGLCLEKFSLVVRDVSGDRLQCFV